LVSGVFESNNLSDYQPSNSEDGRSLKVVISGSNTDFSQPVEVVITGISEIYTVSEILSFDDYGSLNTSYLYKSISDIRVSAKPINANKAAAVVEIVERYRITYSENSGLVPVIK